jgi:predicted RNase H-like nuclease (RuvC/YqgF family)
MSDETEALRGALRVLQQEQAKQTKQFADFQATAQSLAMHDRNWGATKETLDGLLAKGHANDEQVEKLERRIAELETWRGSTMTLLNLFRASVTTAFKSAGLEFRFIQGN